MGLPRNPSDRSQHDLLLIELGGLVLKIALFGFAIGSFVGFLIGWWIF